MAPKKKTPTAKKSPKKKKTNSEEIEDDTGWTSEDCKWRNAVIKKRQKYFGKDPQRENELLQLILSGSTYKKDQTPYLALMTILLAHQIGFLPPPWACKIFRQTIMNRLHGGIHSLDITLGLSGVGTGTTSPFYKDLLQNRNSVLCKDVYRWKISGERTDELACIKTIERLLATPNWNDLAYNLDLIKPQSEKNTATKTKASSSLKEKRIASILDIYRKWKRKMEKEHPFTLETIKEDVLKNPAAFRALACTPFQRWD